MNVWRFYGKRKNPLTYKGRPLRRKDNLIYYGDMADSHIILLQIMDTKPVGDMNVATKVSIQLQLTSPPPEGPGPGGQAQRERQPVCRHRHRLCLAGARPGRSLTPVSEREADTNDSHTLRPRVMAAGLLAASVLSVTALAAPAGGFHHRHPGQPRPPPTSSASQAMSSSESPIAVDPSQASGEIQVVYQDASGVERTAAISAVAAQAETYACINAGGDALRVRQGPGTSYGILCSVYDGDRFPITGKTNGWYQILCNGRTGYVSAEFVIVQDSNTVTKPNGDPASNPLGEQIVAFALQYVGYPYIYGTAGPDTFDCSGFTSYVYAHFGYKLNRSSKDQIKDGVAVSKENLQQGGSGALLQQRFLSHPCGSVHRRRQHRPRLHRKGRREDQQPGYQLLHPDLFRRPAGAVSTTF